MSYTMDIEYLDGQLVIIDPEEYLYSDSEGHGRGWKIKRTIPYDGPYFKINLVNPGTPYPIHIEGRNNDLGWIRPSAIVEVKQIKARWEYDDY